MTKREIKYHNRKRLKIDLSWHPQFCFDVKNTNRFIGIIPTIERMTDEERDNKFGYPRPINLDNFFNNH